MSSPGGDTAKRPSAEETDVEGGVRRSRLQLGSVVDRYVVLEEVGRGNVGVVYAAYDPRLDRRIALKVSDHGGATEAARGRMQREAQALARLTHPNVVTVFDVAFTDAQVCIAMEYLDGGSLDAWLGAQSRSWREVVEVFIAAGRGLAAAHAAGIVHRDFKPSNVVVTADGRVKVTDFGLARGTSSVEVPITPLPDASVIDAQLTAPGSFVGTAAFMAAEQFETGAGSPAADQFSFCVSLYRGLYGVAPFPGHTPFEILQSVVVRAPKPPPGTAGAPRKVEQAVLRGLARDPDERHLSMNALLEALESSLHRGRGRALVAGAALVVATSVAAIAIVREDDECEDVTIAINEAWNATRKAEIGATFDALDVPYAAAARTAVEEGLDRYTTAWIDERTQACRAAHEGVPPDQAIACLERAREHVSAIVEVLLEADAAIAASAVTLLDTAPDPHRCSDPARAPIGLVADLRDWPEVERVRSQIARGYARTAAEKPAEGAAILERALADAREVQSPALEAEAELRLGIAYANLGEQGRAVGLLEEALELALAIGADDLAAEMVSALLVYDGDNLANIERGRIWERLARGYLERFADDPFHRLDLGDALAVFESADGRYEDALRRLDSLEEDTDAFTPNQRLRLMVNRGLVYQRADRRADAIRTYEEAIVYARETFGEGHPRVTDVSVRLAYDLASSGRVDEAVKLYEEAISDRRRVGSSTDLAGTLADMGIALALGGNWERALEVTLEAGAILERDAPDHGHLLSVRQNTGHMLLGLDRPREALAAHEAALVLRRERGHTGVMLIMTLASVAEAAIDAEQPERAMEAIAEAERYAPELPRPSMQRSLLLRTKAQALRATERKQEAFDTMRMAYAELMATEASPNDVTGMLGLFGQLAFDLR